MYSNAAVRRPHTRLVIGFLHLQQQHLTGWTKYIMHGRVLSTLCIISHRNVKKNLLTRICVNYSELYCNMRTACNSGDTTSFVATDVYIRHSSFITYQFCFTFQVQSNTFRRMEFAGRWCGLSAEFFAKVLSTNIIADCKRCVPCKLERFADQAFTPKRSSPKAEGFNKLTVNRLRLPRLFFCHS